MKRQIIVGDALACLQNIADESVHCCVTSPPYWGLRDYGTDGQLGLENSPQEYVERMVTVFREVRRVLRTDGTLWLNLGDTYASRGGMGFQGKHGQRFSRRHTQRSILGNTATNGLKSKDLAGIPWRVAFALQDDGWYLRQDIIWNKPNPMPESVKDRCTKSHEYIFLLSKSENYYFSTLKEEARFKEGPRNKRPHSKTNADGSIALRTRANLSTIGPRETRTKRSVWTVTTRPFKGAHFATFPTQLVEPCICAGCPDGGIVLDPFFGAGTTGLVATNQNKGFIGIEINQRYAEMAKERIFGPLFSRNTGTV